MKVKRFQIDMFILCFDQFLEEKLQLERKRFVARKKQNQIRAQDVQGILKKYFYLIWTYLTKIQNGGQMTSYGKL